MGFIIWLIVGGIIGWLASLIMKTDAQQGILTNVVVGILDAFLGAQLFGRHSINTGISIPSIATTKTVPSAAPSAPLTFAAARSLQGRNYRVVFRPSAHRPGGFTMPAPPASAPSGG